MVSLFFPQLIPETSRSSPQFSSGEEQGAGQLFQPEAGAPALVPWTCSQVDPGPLDGYYYVFLAIYIIAVFPSHVFYLFDTLYYT